VCRVIGALLRGYNDVTPDRRRQDLYGCASDVVGTRASTEVEAQRLARCVDALGEVAVLRSRSPLWRVRSAGPRALERMIVGAGIDQPIEEFLGGLARMFVAGGGRGHTRALALVGELVAIDPDRPGAGARWRPQGPSHATSASSMS